MNAGDRDKLDNPLEQKLHDLEQELSSTEVMPTPVNPPYAAAKDSLGLKRLFSWYQGLSQSSQVIVAVVAVLVALSLLNLVLKLVVSLIAIAILGTVLFGLYRAFVEPSSSDSNPQP